MRTILAACLLAARFATPVQAGAGWDDLSTDCPDIMEVNAFMAEAQKVCKGAFPSVQEKEAANCVMSKTISTGRAAAIQRRAVARFQHEFKSHGEDQCDYLRRAAQHYAHPDKDATWSNDTPADDAPPAPQPNPVRERVYARTKKVVSPEEACADTVGLTAYFAEAQKTCGGDFPPVQRKAALNCIASKSVPAESVPSIQEQARTRFQDDLKQYGETRCTATRGFAQLYARYIASHPEAEGIAGRQILAEATRQASEPPPAAEPAPALNPKRRNPQETCNLNASSINKALAGKWLKLHGPLHGRTSDDPDVTICDGDIELVPPTDERERAALTITLLQSGRRLPVIEEAQFLVRYYEDGTTRFRMVQGPQMIP